MAFRLFMWILMLFGGSALSLWLDIHWARPLFFNLPFHLLSLILGVALLKLVLNISRNTGRYLSRMGREGDIPKTDTNKLVTEGMYGCMRHPMHLGLLFFPLSIALILGSPTFIFFLAPIEALLMILLIKIMEEPEAIRKFGDAYREYRKRVPMFSLRRDCIRLLLEEQERPS